MRLRDAIVHVDREYEMEAKRRFTDPLWGATASAVMKAEYLEIRATALLDTIKQGREILPAEIAEWLDSCMLMAFRFGMRVQRKLDNPGQPTTILDSPCRVAGTDNSTSPDAKQEPGTAE